MMIQNNVNPLFFNIDNSPHVAFHTFPDTRFSFAKVSSIKNRGTAEAAAAVVRKMKIPLQEKCPIRNAPITGAKMGPIIAKDCRKVIAC